MRLLLWSLSALASLLLLLFTILIYRYSYTDFCYQLLSYYHQLSRLSKFQVFFSYERFIIFKIIITTLFILSLVWLWLLKKKINLFLFNIFVQQNCWIKMLKSFFKPYKTLVGRDKFLLIIFLLILVVSRFFYLLHAPFHIDERFSYLYFVGKGFFVSAAYYPNPNNHILYSLVCSFFKIFISNPKWAMKAPVFLIGLLSPVILFASLRKYLSFATAFIAIIIFSFSFYDFYYSMMGRGYALMSLMLIIAVFSLFRINFSENNKGIYRAIFIASCAMGFLYSAGFYLPFLRFGRMEFDF